MKRNVLDSTEMQRTIEEVVTQGRGYERTNSRTPFEFQETILAPWLNLANYDVMDGKMEFIDAFLATSPIVNLVSRMKKAGIPLNSITDADGLEIALNSVQYPIMVEKVQNSLKGGYLLGGFYDVPVSRDSMEKSTPEIKGNLLSN